MPREHIGMVREGEHWGKEIEPGQGYLMYADKVNGGKLTAVVVTGVNIHVLSNGVITPLVTVRIMGETHDENHVCMPADYFVESVQWSLT